MPEGWASDEEEEAAEDWPYLEEDEECQD